MGSIRYHNNSPHELTYLWMHLEQNLFKSDSVGALTTEPESRFGFRKGTHGGYDIAFVRAGRTDLPLHVYDTMGRIDRATPFSRRPYSKTDEGGTNRELAAESRSRVLHESRIIGPVAEG